MTLVINSYIIYSAEFTMKFFDYQKLYEEANGDSERILKLFHKYPSAGPNFIINTHVLRDNMGYSARARAEYLGLCALRRYDNYAYLKQVDLDRYLIPPWVPIQVVQQNPLINLTDSKIIFKEEKDLWQLSVSTH